MQVMWFDGELIAKEKLLPRLPARRPTSPCRIDDEDFFSQTMWKALGFPPPQIDVPPAGIEHEHAFKLKCSASVA